MKHIGCVQSNAQTRPRTASRPCATATPSTGARISPRRSVRRDPSSLYWTESRRSTRLILEEPSLKAGWKAISFSRTCHSRTRRAQMYPSCEVSQSQLNQGRRWRSLAHPGAASQRLYSFLSDSTTPPAARCLWTVSLFEIGTSAIYARRWVSSRRSLCCLLTGERSQPILVVTSNATAC